MVYQQGVRPLEPAIPLFPNAQPVPASVQVNCGETPSFTSGDLTVNVKTSPYSFTFDSPKGPITKSHPKCQFVADVAHKWTLSSASSTTCLANDISANPYRSTDPNTVRYIVQEFNISPGEKFYGFGEQFGNFVKNGPVTACIARIYFSPHL